MTLEQHGDRLAIQALLAEYGGLLDLGCYDDWLALFAAECRYAVVPRENHDAGLPVALILCDSRAMLEDRIAALRQANKYNLHTDRHIIGLPRIIATDAGRIDARIDIEAPFAVYQTDQEGETILFATGLYRDRLERGAPEHDAPEHGKGALRIVEKLVLLDTFAVPTLLATPL